MVALASGLDRTSAERNIAVETAAGRSSRTAAAVGSERCVVQGERMYVKQVQLL